MGWAKTYLKLAEDKDKPSVIPGLVATGLGATAAGAMPALSLHEYLTKTHPTAFKALQAAPEFEHEDLAHRVRVGDVLLHGVPEGESLLGSHSSAAATLPSGLPATHAVNVGLFKKIHEGGHMLRDSASGPIADRNAWGFYGAKDTKRILSESLSDPAELEKATEKLRREHDVIRGKAELARGDILGRLRGETVQGSAHVHAPHDTSVESYLRGDKEPSRPQMVLRRRGGLSREDALAQVSKELKTPVEDLGTWFPEHVINRKVDALMGRRLTKKELDYLTAQGKIDALTPYGATRGTGAGIKSLLLPTSFTKQKSAPLQANAAKLTDIVCDPGTNICSSVPARLLQHTGGGGIRNPKDVLPGHLLTDYNVDPVAVTKKTEWLRQLAAARKNRILMGAGAIGTTGLLGGLAGYGLYRAFKPKDQER